MELAENLVGAVVPEQYVLVMQDLLRRLLEERARLVRALELLGVSV